MEAFMDWKERFRDEVLAEPEPKPTCDDCSLCVKPDDWMTTDERIAWCKDCGEFCHRDWEASDCESFQSY